MENSFQMEEEVSQKESAPDEENVEEKRKPTSIVVSSSDEGATSVQKNESFESKREKISASKSNVTSDFSKKSVKIPQEAVAPTLPPNLYSEPPPDKSGSLTSSPPPPPPPQATSDSLSPPPPLARSDSLSPPPPMARSDSLSPPPPMEKSDSLSPPPPQARSDSLSPPPPMAKSDSLSPPPPMAKSDSLSPPPPMAKSNSLSPPPPMAKSDSLSPPPPTTKSESQTAPTTKTDSRMPPSAKSDSLASSPAPAAKSDSRMPPSVKSESMSPTITTKSDFVTSMPEKSESRTSQSNALSGAPAAKSVSRTPPPTTGSRMSTQAPNLDSRVSALASAISRTSPEPDAVSRTSATPLPPPLPPTDAAVPAPIREGSLAVFRTGILQTNNFTGFPSYFYQKRSPFIHNPPQPEERRTRIASPRTPIEYIINLREDLADFQESHGLPRTRDYSFVSLGLALAQETGRAIYSLIQMFTELFPVVAIVSLILRFALDKLIEILETAETGPKVKKAFIFALEMIAIMIPLWILIGTIIIPLISLILAIIKKVTRIKGGRRKCATQPKPKVAKACSYFEHGN